MNTLNFILTDKNEATCTKKVCTLVNGQVQVQSSTVAVADISALRDFLTTKRTELGVKSFCLADGEISACTVIEIPTGNNAGEDMLLPVFYQSKFAGPTGGGIPLFSAELEAIIKTKILAK